jgi:hypothetical protein
MATQYGYSAVLATDLHSAVYGSYKLQNEPLVLLMIAIIFYHTLIIAVFFADWDGRFLLHFFPLIGVLSALELITWCTCQRKVTRSRHISGFRSFRMEWLAAVGAKKALTCKGFHFSQPFSVWRGV